MAAIAFEVGAWAQMSADLDLGLVYAPLEMPTGDFYGGNRPGNTLFDESLVALDLKTGKRKWHYQMTHHGVWDEVRRGDKRSRENRCGTALTDAIIYCPISEGRYRAGPGVAR